MQHSQDTSDLPKSAPTGFVQRRWVPYVMPGGVVGRRHYELCVLSELRDRLLAGDVWVAGSRRYRSVEERLISQQTFEDLRRAGTLPVAVEADFETNIIMVTRGVALARLIRPAGAPRYLAAAARGQMTFCVAMPMPSLGLLAARSCWRPLGRSHQPPVAKPG